MTKEIKEQINEMLRKHNEGEINEKFWDAFVKVTDNGFDRDIETYVMVNMSETLTVYCNSTTVSVIVLSDFDTKTMKILHR